MVLTCGPVAAEIIPPDRIYDWTPGVNVGVPGGIPHRTVIGATVDADAYGKGKEDASAALGAAIDACPPGQVVKIPAGTYRLDSRVYRAYAGNLTIRGAGMGKTILKATSTTQVIYKLGFPNMGNNGFSKTWGPTTPPDYTAQAANQPGGDSHGTRGKTLQELDLNVKNTMIRHGNYDYLNHSITWDAAISDQAIPNSFFRSSKPVWFGSLPWPPFDPANPPGAFNDANVCRIPAGYRYVHGIDPVAGW